MVVFLEGPGRTYMWIEAVMVASLGPENISCLILFTGTDTASKCPLKGSKTTPIIKKMRVIINLSF